MMIQLVAMRFLILAEYLLRTPGYCGCQIPELWWAGMEHDHLSSTDGTSQGENNTNRKYQKIPGYHAQVVGRALIELGLSRHHSLGVITGSSSSQALICHLAAVFAG